MFSFFDRSLSSFRWARALLRKRLRVTLGLIQSIQLIIHILHLAMPVLRGITALVDSPLPNLALPVNTPANNIPHVICVRRVSTRNIPLRRAGACPALEVR
jgi:hypothetical protein